MYTYASLSQVTTCVVTESPTALHTNTRGNVVQKNQELEVKINLAGEVYKYSVKYMPSHSDNGIDASVWTALIQTCFVTVLFHSLASYYSQNVGGERA